MWLRLSYDFKTCFKRVQLLFMLHKIVVSKLYGKFTQSYLCHKGGIIMLCAAVVGKSCTVQMVLINTPFQFNDLCKQKTTILLFEDRRCLMQGLGVQ